MLKFNEIVAEKFNERSNKDRRFRVNRLVCSYLDEQGIEYRKSFEFPTNTSYDAMVAYVKQDQGGQK